MLILVFDESAATLEPIGPDLILEELVLAKEGIWTELLEVVLMLDETVLVPLCTGS